MTEEEREVFLPVIETFVSVLNELIKGKLFTNLSKDQRHSLSLSKKTREKQLAQAFQT